MGIPVVKLILVNAAVLYRTPFASFVGIPVVKLILVNTAVLYLTPFEIREYSLQGTFTF